ncbi:hypothetical protein [Enterococcus gallinarum]|uniref:Uncharacterized protein n=1 Tax=Enterococcus gallinarum TaxID=1353 RepID=A0ABD4ZWT8_ENTGA|nr:hypothetical protein [Enterococcus gallinarum]MBF0725128.1 hypothetical protein [Enterococcus gallinarum]MBX8979325.1 hypothetical protein [Enterococcus gallinarum]MCR1932070.1 hypothetical protein [Enterococcus gallinarum]MDL4876647.1 hypothetical protein [Enterococcus gallinarum]MDL4883025.1 hypothetical protein [Enterococcus gallinarum]
MNLFKRKPKFIYALSGCEDLLQDKLFDAYELVEYIAKEDYRFQRDYLEGTVRITKMRNNAKRTVYFSKQIHLPQGEDTNWLEELSEFFTKKPLVFSVEETVPDHSEKEDSQVREAITLEEFEQDPQEELKEAATLDLLSIKASSEKESEAAIVANQVAAPVETKFIQVPEDEFLSLKKAVEAQTREIAKLKEERLQVTEEVLQEELPLPIGKHSSETLDKEFEIDVNQLEIEASSDEIVQSVLQSTKAEINQTLAKFVETETEKIKEEIKRLDKRDRIEDDVTKRLEGEERDQMATMNHQLASEKDQQIKEEKMRHQQALQAIEQLFLSQLQEKTAAIKDTYRKKIEQTIREEYDRQTEELSRILQGKMDELKIRQRAMNTGLKANFKEALANFNRGHTQVIQVVEQKKQCSPIDLWERRRVKQA